MENNILESKSRQYSKKKSNKSVTICADTYRTTVESKVEKLITNKFKFITKVNRNIEKEKNLVEKAEKSNSKKNVNFNNNHKNVNSNTGTMLTMMKTHKIEDSPVQSKILKCSLGRKIRLSGKLGMKEGDEIELISLRADDSDEEISPKKKLTLKFHSEFLEKRRISSNQKKKEELKKTLEMKKLKLLELKRKKKKKTIEEKKKAYKERKVNTDYLQDLRYSQQVITFQPNSILKNSSSNLNVSANLRGSSESPSKLKKRVSFNKKMEVLKYNNKTQGNISFGQNSGGFCPDYFHPKKFRVVDGKLSEI